MIGPKLAMHRYFERSDSPLLVKGLAGAVESWTKDI